MQTVCDPVCLYCSGGETFGRKTHIFLPDALWESPLQQPSVEELECTGSPSDDNHRKQLQWDEG